MTLTGRCACGTTKYTLIQEPKFSYLCQCRQCQKATGAGHAALMMVAAEALEVHGRVKAYSQRSDSGNVNSRHFCRVCGTPLVFESSGYPHLRFLTAGSLDDPSRFSPTQVLWHSAGQPWDLLDSSLKLNDHGV